MFFQMCAVAMQRPYLFGLDMFNGLQYIVPVYMVGYVERVVLIYLQILPAGCEQPLHPFCINVSIKSKGWHNVHISALLLHQLSAVDLIFAGRIAKLFI